MKMIQKIKYVLCNENGSPNLESIIGLAIATVIMSGIWKIGRALYVYYYTTPTVPTVAKAGRTEEGIVIGYKIGR